MICKRSELECIRSAMKDLASSEPLIDLMVYEDALKTTTRLEILGTARPNSLETARTFRESQGANRHVLPEREREREECRLLWELIFGHIFIFGYSDRNFQRSSSLRLSEYLREASQGIENEGGCRRTYVFPSELQNWIIHQKPNRRKIGGGIAAPGGSSWGG